MVYPGNELSLAEVIRRYQGDPAEYEVTQKLFGNIGLILFCLESVSKEDLSKIKSGAEIDFIRIYPVSEIDDDVKEECKYKSGFWNINGNKKNFIENFRDCIAHMNISLIGNGKIDRIVMWNCYKEKNVQKINATISLSIEEIYLVIDRLLEFCKVCGYKSRKPFKVK